MTQSFTKLSDTDLRALTAALRSRRVAPPYSELQISRVLPASIVESASTTLSQFSEQGFTSEQIVSVLELLSQDRSEGRPIEPPIDLVTSGPEAPGISNRDTSVVVRELFAHADKSVLVVGYAVRVGQLEYFWFNCRSRSALRVPKRCETQFLTVIGQSNAAIALPFLVVKDQLLLRVIAVRYF